MPLTDANVRNAKPGPKPFRIYDERGLYLEVRPTGAKWWRFKYRFGGVGKLLSLGTYPDIPLKKARDRRDEARRLVADGVDPSAQRRAAKAAAATAVTFEAVAREWHERAKASWSDVHADRVLQRLVADVFPRIGTKPIRELTVDAVLETVRKIESRGAIETAHRALAIIGLVLRYAVVTNRADIDVSASLRGDRSGTMGVLRAPKAKNHAALTQPEDVGRLMRSIAGYRGSRITRCALQVAPLVFVRPGELRHAEWAEIDLEGALWTIPASKMKGRLPHMVPLSRRAVSLLRELHEYTGSGRYVFPSLRGRDRPMSENTILAALRSLGYASDEMTGHGFRAMARTLLDEVLGFRIDWVEHQLAHSVKDPLGRAYNRTSHLDGRREMMETWARYLELLAVDGVTPDEARRRALAGSANAAPDNPAKQPNGGPQS